MRKKVKKLNIYNASTQKNIIIHKQIDDLQWSDTIEPMFGFDRGKFGATYQSFLICVHPDDRQFVMDSVDACVKEGKEYDIEHRIARHDRTVRWVSETGDVIRDKNNKAIRML